MSQGRCYGCSSASAEWCVTLLRALATNPRLRVTLCSYGLIPQLLEHNLRRGTPQVGVRPALTHRDWGSDRVLTHLALDSELSREEIPGSGTL